MVSTKRVLPELITRLLGAVVGGYGFSAMLVALLAALMVRGGLARSEAVVIASMAGFLIYLTLLVWAFSNVKVRTLWAALTVGTGSAYGLLMLTT